MADFNESNADANLTACLNGAIQRMIINGESIMANSLLTGSTERANISSYLGPPCDLSNKCENKSQCIPSLNSYECKSF